MMLGRVFMDMTIGMGVRHLRVGMHMHHARHMAIVNQAGSDGMLARQSV